MVAKADRTGGGRVRRGGATAEVGALRDRIAELERDGGDPISIKFLSDLRVRVHEGGVPNRYALLEWITDYDWP